MALVSLIFSLVRPISALIFMRTKDMSANKAFGLAGFVSLALDGSHRVLLGSGPKLDRCFRQFRRYLYGCCARSVVVHVLPESELSRKAENVENFRLLGETLALLELSAVRMFLLAFYQIRGPRHFFGPAAGRCRK